MQFTAVLGLAALAVALEGCPSSGASDDPKVTPADGGVGVGNGPAGPPKWLGVHYVKDNRLLPDGFDRKNRWAAFTATIGTDGDASFGSSDTVTYRIARAPAGSTIDVRLLFQVARPSDIEALAEKPTPAARKLFDMTTAAPPLPVVVATASARTP